jgi:hypothetical protein
MVVCDLILHQHTFWRLH